MSAWKTLNEEKIPEIKAWVAEVSKGNKPVHIGTDSLQTGRYTQFVTVVAVLTPGKGGRAAYSRFVVPRMKSLRERLLREVWESVRLGLDLTGLVDGDMFVHIDANPVIRHASSRYIQELVGMAVSNGFKAVIKPDAWAAAHAADHIVRVHGKMPKGVAA